jgi:neuroligin
MSGSALSPWSVSTSGVKYAKEVASFLNCPNDAKKYHSMVDCLRRKSIEELLSAEPINPSYLSTFGPSIDSATIRGDPLSSMMSSESSFGDYDLMLGVTKIESYDIFNAEDIAEGIDENRRDRILRTLVRNLFDYRLQVRNKSYYFFLLILITFLQKLSTF